MAWLILSNTDKFKAKHCVFVMYFKNVIFVAKMCKYGIFVAEIYKYGIFVAKIVKFALIDSFLWFSGSHGSATNYATLHPPNPILWHKNLSLKAVI